MATDEDAAVLTAGSSPARPEALGALDLGAAEAECAGEHNQGFTPGLLTDTPPEGVRSGERAGGEGLGFQDGQPDPVRQALVFEPEDQGAGPLAALSLSIGAMLGIGAGVSARGGASDEGVPLTGEPASPGAEETGEFAWSPPQASPPGPEPSPHAPDQARDAAPGQAATGPQLAEHRGLEHHGACIVRLPPGAAGDADPFPSSACDAPSSGRLRGGNPEPLGAQQPDPAHAVGSSDAGLRPLNPALGAPPSAPARSAFPCGGAAANGWAASCAPDELGSDEDEEGDARAAHGDSMSGSDYSDEEPDVAPDSGCELLRDESIEETLVGSFTKLHVSPPGSPPDAPAAPPPPAAWAHGHGAKEP